MKKLIYGGAIIALIGMVIFGCQKENISDQSSKEAAKSLTKPTSSGENHEKAIWPFNIDIKITFDHIRLARATTNRKRDGKNCGCNECFGICNKPWNDIDDNGIFGTIGVQEISKEKIMIYFLNSLPSNFESEFGIDDPVILENNGISYDLSTGVYEAIKEEGELHCLYDNKDYIYYGKVLVNLEK